MRWAEIGATALLTAPEASTWQTSGPDSSGPSSTGSTTRAGWCCLPRSAPSSARAACWASSTAASASGRIDGFFEMADRLQAEIDAGTGHVTQEAIRSFASEAHEVTPDQQGRIVVPARLRDLRRPRLRRRRHRPHPAGRDLGRRQVGRPDRRVRRRPHLRHPGPRHLTDGRARHPHPFDPAHHRHHRPPPIREERHHNRDVREAASIASSPPGGATEGPFSARFPSWPSRGDIPAALRQPGGWR